jgi:hypothetical protein
MTDNQRWRQRRDSYRPAGEVIDTSKYGVEAIDEDLAKRFVREHHYSGSFPAARMSFGLFRGIRIVGVMVFSQPGNNASIPAYSTAEDGAELGRLVLLDDVPGNGESWFLGHCFRWLREKRPTWGAIHSYSDPVPRTTVDGFIVKPGHVGTIYQAFNGVYVGRARAENLILDNDGRVINRRTLTKLKNDERGAGYAYEILLKAGAPPRRPFEDGPTYVARAIAEGPFRRSKHPGNHTYCWPLRRNVQLKKKKLPYPKMEAQPSW